MKNVQQTTKIRVAITSVDHSTMSVVVRDSNGDSDCGAPGGAQIQGCSGSSNIATGYPGGKRAKRRERWCGLAALSPAIHWLMDTVTIRDASTVILLGERTRIRWRRRSPSGVRSQAGGTRLRRTRRRERDRECGTPVDQ